MSDTHELRLLLASEIKRRLPTATDDPAQARSLLHALRGSAAMAGESELALVLNQLGSKLRAGEHQTTRQVRRVLTHAEARLARGDSAFGTRWPTPPLGLQPLQHELPAEYLAGMRERLAAWDALLERAASPQLVDDIYRALHNLKSAASAGGDHITTWYCHGLEAHLMASRERASAQALVKELSRHRAVIAALIADPWGALRTLSRLDETQSSAATSAADAPRTGADESSKRAPRAGGGSLQVPERALDSLLDRMQRLDQIRDDLNRAADIAGQFAERSINQREQLNEALRLIGPPRPWGAPEAALRAIQHVARGLGSASLRAKRGAQVVKTSTDRIRTETTNTRVELTQLRRTSLRWLLSRLESAALELAAQQGKALRVHTSGGDLPIDRRLAERLLDPALQLVRNAVTHGIGGGPPARGDGQLWLQGSRVGGWLRLNVEDDGRGLDLEALSALAPAGSPTRAAQAAFLPGVSTRQHADAFGGRGLGLPMAESVLTKLGGTLHLTAREPRGTRASIEIPAESGMIDVIWIGQDEHEFALPVVYARRAVRNAPHLEAVSLARCLGLPHPRKPLETAVELELSGLAPVFLAVSSLRPAETVNIHPVPSRVARRGPYSGAVLRRGGKLALVLHGPVIALRAQLVTAGHASTTPPGPGHS